MANYAYSLDGEYYYNGDQIKTDIEYTFEDDEEIKVFIGEQNLFKHSSFINSRRLIDDMQEIAYEEAGEFADDYLANITQNQLLELEILISNFLAKNCGSVNFYTVTNIKTIIVKVGDWSFIK